MDFGALPPEINSGRIYAGPGSAPLLAAASAWDALASELQTTAASYAATMTELTSSGWQGPSSAAAADAATPYTAWLASTAAQAEQTASQAKAAAGAYEAAFTASVPPPVIAANRAALAVLVATNLLGQNTPAIAANEATYAEFWAQDAVAMYSYAGASAAASQLTPFSAPPTTTNAAQSTDTDSLETWLTELNTVLTNLGTKINAVPAELSTLEGELHTALTNLVGPLTLPAPYSTIVSGAITNLQNFFSTSQGLVADIDTGPFSPGILLYLIRKPFQVGISIPNIGTSIQGIGPLLNPKPVVGALSPLLHSGLLSGSFEPAGVGTTVSAAASRAGTIGALSVPQNWASAVPAVRTVAAEMDASAVDAAPEMASIGQNGMFGETAMASLAGRAIAGTATRAVAGSAYRVPGAVAADEIATTATIIVIPPSPE